MPFALTTIGIILIVIGFQDTYRQFGALVVNDFSGPQSFFWWLVAIGSVGAIGYIKELEGFSRAFMALIVIGIFLSNGKNGFFQQFTNAIKQGSTTPVNPIGGNLQGGSSSGGSGSSTGGGGSDILGNVLGDVGAIASFF